MNSDDQDRADGQRTQTLTQLRHADCLVTLGQVSSRVAHDVGTPLAVIAGRSSMIANGQVTGDDVKRSAAIIAEQAERIREVLQRLIELTRWQSAAFDRRPIGELVSQGLMVIEPLARAKQITFAVEHEDDQLEPRADRQHVLQVVTNLACHAIESAAPGSQIRVKVERFEVKRGLDPRVPPGTHVQVRVCHTPQRQEEAKAPQVYDLFHVVQAQYVASYFGVAISDAIIRSHGGRLSVERLEDGAHCATFHIPLAP